MADEKADGDPPSKNADVTGSAKDGDNKDKDAPAAAKPQARKADAPTASSDLSPEIRTKLRKLEKLEATYPGESLATTQAVNRQPYCYLDEDNNLTSPSQSS